MNRRLGAVFAFALVGASLTSFLVYHLILLRMQSNPRSASRHKISVATHDLQVGALIQDADLQEVSWNSDLPDQALKSRQELVGRGVIATVYQGEPIIGARLAAKGAGAGLAATIPPGKRAVALRVNEVVGLAGFVLPGMRVDVLVAGMPPGAELTQSGTLSRTVLQNIEVLSAGQRIGKNAAGKPETAQVVNLLVTPDQAEILNLASSEMKVQLAQSARYQGRSYSRHIHRAALRSTGNQAGDAAVPQNAWLAPAPVRSTSRSSGNDDRRGHQRDQKT